MSITIFYQKVLPFLYVFSSNFAIFLTIISVDFGTKKSFQFGSFLSINLFFKRDIFHFFFWIFLSKIASVSQHNLCLSSSKSSLKKITKSVLRDPILFAPVSIHRLCLLLSKIVLPKQHKRTWPWPEFLINQMLLNRLILLNKNGLENRFLF